MIPSRRNARKRLKDCLHAEYEKIIHAAKLTPIQQKILTLYILEDLPIYEIAFRVGFCESLIRRRLAEIYDKVAFL